MLTFPGKVTLLGHILLYTKNLLHSVTFKNLSTILQYISQYLFSLIRFSFPLPIYVNQCETIQHSALTINVDFPMERDPIRTHTPLRKIDCILLHLRTIPPYSKTSLTCLFSFILVSFHWCQCTTIQHRHITINVDFPTEGDPIRTHTSLYEKNRLHSVTFNNFSTILQDISLLFAFINYSFHFSIEPM